MPLLNTLMSVSEFGVVVGVALEGTEYVPCVHAHWPWLKKLGFVVLVISLIGDWHFQSAINTSLTNEIIAADTRIVGLLPRTAILNGQLAMLAKVASPYSGQKFKMSANLQTADDREEVRLCAIQLLAMLSGAKWLNPFGKQYDLTKGFDPNIEYDPPDRTGVYGIFFETASGAPLRTQEAAELLTKAVKSIGLFAYHDVVTKGLPAPSDDVIVITVARRLEF